MKLLPGWNQRLADVRQPAAPAIRLPLAPELFAGEPVLVCTAGEADRMAQLAAERAVAYVGFDTEFRYDRPPVLLDRKKEAHDPRSIHPLLLSLTLAEPAGGAGTIAPGGRLYSFVVDLRRAEVLDGVRRVLRLPVPFVGHFAQVELFCLYQIGLPAPATLWDTWVAEKVRHLGRQNAHYKLPAGADDLQQARAKQETEEDGRFRLSLPATCRRYGVAYPFEQDKERLQRSFLDHASGAPFSREQVAYAAADADAAARLYGHQVGAATEIGSLDHLVRIEMPWVAVNARMIWNGVRIDRGTCGAISRACERHLPELEARIGRVTGGRVANFRSHPQLKAFFEGAGLIDAFRRAGNVTFDKGQLKDCRHLHPVIP